MHLSSLARSKVAELVKFTALAWGAEPGHEYAATPTIAQTLNDKIIVEGGWFLGMVNVIPVAELSGEKVIIGTSGNVTSRTDTSGAGERSAKNLVDTDGLPYQLYKTDSDVALRYTTIDTWAKFSDFRDRYNRAVRKAIANDRVKIGWVGTSAATDSVAADLSDVNIGWLEQIRNYNGGAQYVLGAAGSVTLGSATFPNLDTLVYDALNRIEEQHREDPDLVVLIGRNVMQAAKGSYYESQGGTPSEKEKLREAAVVDTYGGLRAYQPPFFPADAILVTSFENLSIYWQEDSWRRQQIDNPKKDQYEDFNSRNEGYVVEHFGKTSLVEGIEYQ